MTPQKPSSSRTGKNLGRKAKNTYTTKSGQTIKINRSLADRFKSHRAANAQKRAERLAGMPKSRVKRFFYRMHPKRMYKYWFSREGGIMALKLTGVGILAGFLLIVGVFAYFRKDLPDITDVSGNNIGGSIQYYDRTGKTLLWEDFDAVKRIPVPEDKISDNIKKATVAIEDKDFFKHGGFDVRGIIRAGVNNAFGSGGTQGGSTITQQLVKLSQDWSNRRTLARKISEVILSVELERSYSKEQILGFYLNVAPYGNIENGVEAGANDYFHKSAKDLTIEEAAFMAAIPKSPSVYSPYGPYYDKQGLLDRQHYIIDQMVTQGMITQEDGDKAKLVNILKKVKPQAPKYAGIKAPYFVLAARDEVNSKVAPESANRGGWKVITTLDMDLQKIAEDATKNNIANINRYGADQSAMVAEDNETGQIVALVGGVNFNGKTDGSKINYAHSALIPPGSSFKPYDYTALIDKTETAGGGSVLYDTRGALPGYPCDNKNLPKNGGNCLMDYDFRFPGPLTLRYSLGGSRNIPAVKANLIVGTDKVIDMADKMMANPDNPKAYNCYRDEKLTKTAPCYGASAIGDGAFLHLDDHVNGLATLARLGKAIPRTYILEVKDSANKTMRKFEQPKGEQVIRPDSAYIVNDMASDPNASYLPAGYYKFHRFNGWNFAIKTGTTNDGYDGLMASWSTKYTVVSWVGHHSRQVTLRGAMEYMTTPLTKTWMEGAHAKLKTPVNWQKPSGVKTAPAYVVRVNPGIGAVVPSSGTDLYPSWWKQPSATNKNQKIDTVSNKLATECTPERAIKNAGGASSNAFSVDTFVDAKAGNTSQKDDVHKCSDVKPSISLAAANKDFTCPNGGCQIRATVAGGTHPLSSDRFKGTVNFMVDGKVVHSQEVSSNGTVKFNYKPDFSGTRTLTAEIIDSVLYTGQDTGDMTAGASEGGGDPGDISPNITSAVEGFPKTKVTWFGGTGTVTIKNTDTGEELCHANAENGQCSGPRIRAEAGDTVRAYDSNGGESDDFVVNN